MINYNKPIKEVEQIKKTGTELKRVEDLDDLVEEPCLEACKDFYEKNLITIQSSANHLETDAWITIDTSTMSDENKAIMQSFLGDEEESEIIVNDRKVNFSIFKFTFAIKVPLIESDTVGSISEILTSISNKFQYQDLLAYRTTFESLVMNLYYNTEDEEFQTQLKSKIDLYDIGIVERYGVNPDELCPTYAKALEFYSKIDPENGTKFVESMIDCINEFPVDIGACDKEDGLFFNSKNNLDKHISWKKNNASKN